jgi:hypothetical protein
MEITPRKLSQIQPREEIFSFRKRQVFCLYFTILHRDSNAIHAIHRLSQVNIFLNKVQGLVFLRLGNFHCVHFLHYVKMETNEGKDDFP